MARAHLTFWFEFASTYSYLTAMRIGDLAAAADVEVTWRPFLLGPILKAQGYASSPFNDLPVKGAYMWADVQRRARTRGLPFHRPDPFPQNGLLAARVATAAILDDQPPEAVAGFCQLVYAAGFGERVQIHNPVVIAACLDSMGLPETLLEKATEDATKAQLRDWTGAAEAAGIFGAPSFTCEDGALFWGDDRLEDALDWARALADG